MTDDTPSQGDRCPNCGVLGDRDETPDGRVCYLVPEGTNKLLAHFPGELDCVLRQLHASQQAVAQADTQLAEWKPVIDSIYEQAPSLRQEGLVGWEGYFTHWQVVISSVARAWPDEQVGYSQDPLELVTRLIDERDDLSKEAAQAEEVRDRFDEEIVAWKEASGLLVDGDPEGVTPAMVEKSRNEDSAEIERLRDELRRSADEAWPDPKDFASFEAPSIYRAYVRRWGALGVLDYEAAASRFMTIPCNAAPWLYEGMSVHCGDELHCKVVDRLRADVAAGLAQGGAAKNDEEKPSGKVS